MTEPVTSGVITIALVGEDRLLALLSSAVRQVSDPVRMLDNIGADYEGRIKERFGTKTDPAGGSWPGLAPATLKRYANEDEGKRQGTLLERTGDMLFSLSHQVVEGDGMALEVLMSRRTHGGKTGPLGGEWSIPLLHDFGTRKMPRRGIFTLDPSAGTLAPADRDPIIAEVEQWLAGVFDTTP